ncbi:MAG: nitroreductase family protein [Synergistaceae bacterium]|nr:nitroreductase family protein [Synergistaceae bacterium]
MTKYHESCKIAHHITSHHYYYALKQFVKKFLGAKNVERVRRVKSAINAAKNDWHKTKHTQQNEREQKIYSVLMSVHMLEKALAMNNTKYLDAINYNNLIQNIADLLDSGVSADSFETAGSIAIIKFALKTLSGHEDSRNKLDSLIAKYNIPENLFKGGCERFTKSEILKYNPENWREFVRARHSVRRFKNSIISSGIINEIINDAKYYPSACNRQPCKVYYSMNPEITAKILRNCDGFVTNSGDIHNCFIVTCDRSLLNQAELNDQELLNSGIFLGYLVMSIHAHGLGSCLFQFLQVNSRQESIKREFGIKSSEIIAAFVGFGELEDEVITACADRRPNIINVIE